jgi:hypothetical protein
VVVVEGGERRLHLGLLGMPLDCEERESEWERERDTHTHTAAAIAQGFLWSNNAFFIITATGSIAVCKISQNQQ